MKRYAEKDWNTLVVFVNELQSIESLVKYTPPRSRVYSWGNCLLRRKKNKNIDSVPLTAFGFYCWWLVW